MKTKRKTKAQREAAQKAALRQRVRDIATGAAGYEFDSDDEFATADFLSRFVAALQITFGNEQNGFLWKPHCLGGWDNIDAATEQLWAHGIR